MNSFVNTLNNSYSVIARTENGMRARANTANAAVDLFGSIGAMRGKDVVPGFRAAFNENPDLAIRIAQFARDVRGGAGERKAFRDILLDLEANNPDILVGSHLLDNVPQIGRFDDLLIFNRGEVVAKAFTIIARALAEGNGLAAKWMPRKGPLAAELREFLRLTPREYRKILVHLTNVVETQMCAQNWNEINFSHVPSVAMSKYMTAFHRNAPEAFQAYKDALKRGDKDVKVNASAVYPHTVVEMLGTASRFGYGFSETRDNVIVAEKMWEALPDYMNDQNVLPMVDVSGSMDAPVGGSNKTTCMNVSVALGLYTATKSKGAFKDVVLTFSSRPELYKLPNGDLLKKIKHMHAEGTDWGMSTNLHAAFDKVLSHAVRNRVAPSDMPKILLILSDMQFDSCTRFDDSAQQMIRRKYEDAGYEAPAIVFWNLREAGNKPVKFNDQGVALVSGFSPAVMKAVLAADLEDFTPYKVMLKAVSIDRYNW